MSSHEKIQKVSIPKTIVFSGISGAIATTCIYPIDLSKTKLHYQKGKSEYTGFFDCLKKTYKAGGARGLYAGWPPNVLLVMPEKALKITCNVMFREMFAKRRGGFDKITFTDEMAAGGLAGLCQVSVTNPMELLKIQGATLKSRIASGQVKGGMGYLDMCRGLGISGLYTGIFVTMLRDIPFSMMYFSAYTTCYNNFRTRWPESPKASALAAGVIAGTASAAITTPVDVIKTRVQSSLSPEASAGKSFAQFWKDEVSVVTKNYAMLLAEAKAHGQSATETLFKGVVPRTMIVSPLFGITMLCFEEMKRKWP